MKNNRITYTIEVWDELHLNDCFSYDTKYQCEKMRDFVEGLGFSYIMYKIVQSRKNPEDFKIMWIERG